MVNSKTSASFVASLKDAASRKVTKGEMLRTADFIHCWLYGKDELPCVQGEETSSPGWSRRKAIVLH